MKRIGVISDTHGTFDEPLRAFLAEVDEIWHAGDIGSLELADEIAAFKPLKAVYGNIDGGMTRRVYSEFEYFKTEDVSVLMTHIGGYPRHYEPTALRKIQAAHPKIFVAGHSHILRIIFDPVYQMLHINPGAAGCYGFHKLRTAVRFTIDGDQIKDMEIWELPRDKQIMQQ
ncbi:MAG: metallophosphoesterase family protein [Alistipes sp.]